MDTNLLVKPDKVIVILANLKIYLNWPMKLYRLTTQKMK